MLNSFEACAGVIYLHIWLRSDQCLFTVKNIPIDPYPQYIELNITDQGK